MPYALKHLFHSTMWVPDLEDATEFFARVFHRKSTVLGEYLGSKPEDVPVGFRNDYATFTPVAEVQLECVDPRLMLIDGVQVHESVTAPKLGALAWFVDGIEDLWSELKARGLHGSDQRRQLPEGEGPPRDVSSTPIIFTVPEETGLAYELCVYMARRDPRGDPPVPALSPTDPLGIQSCSHHTVLTRQPDRALRFLVDVLPGRIVHEGRDELLETRSTYIALADAVVELAEPLVEGSPAARAAHACAPLDTYHSMTWKVGDLDQVAEHLRSAGVRIDARSDTAIVTNPADGLGVAWGFSTVLVDGDPRRADH
jgi:catechol 2,3-dioxygenase-like lactoylglutathione lyase family enzyme